MAKDFEKSVLRMMTSALITITCNLDGYILLDYKILPMTILKWSFTHLAGLRRTFISSYRWRWIMCLLLGMSRALAMVSALKVGSRTITAPWMPLFWRLSAYSCIKHNYFNRLDILSDIFIQLYIVKNCVSIQICIGNTEIPQTQIWDCRNGCWKFSFAYY